MAGTPRVQSRGRSYCSVRGCFNTSETKPDISYFKHPIDEKRRAKWLQLIGREELKDRPGKNYTVCEVHFNVQDILMGLQRKTLKKNALPCLLLPSKPSTLFEGPLDIESEPLVKIEELEDDSEDPLGPIASKPSTLFEGPLDIESEPLVKIEELEEDSEDPLGPIASKPSTLFEGPLDIESEYLVKIEKFEVDSENPLGPIASKPSTLFEGPLDIETLVKIEELEEDWEDTPGPIAESPPEATRKRKLPSPSPGCSKNVVDSLDTQNGNLVFLGHDTFQRLCNKFLTPDLSDIVRAETAVKHLPNKKSLMMLGLNLYHSNPQAYRMLRGALRLPFPTDLHRDVLPITTEINNDIFLSLLTSKVNAMTDIEKNCSAVIASISLKPNLFYNLKHDLIIGFHEIDGIRLSEIADQAYVMMVRGIYSDWKQPVGYALLSSGNNLVEVNEWVDSLLEALIKIGLNVRTLVSDTTNEFIEAAKKRSVSIDRPYFFINDKIIFYIFDAPHLLTLVRNFFIKHDFLFHGCEAKYEHVRTFYDKDKNKKFKLAPKLTKNHIHPTNFEKMEARYAAQLLSNSVATGISTYVDFHVIDTCGRNTADFIKLMNNLFDALNSSDSYTNEHISVYRGVKSQKDFYKEMLLFFRDLKLSNVKCDVKFIEGFQITITSILQLFDELKAQGYTFLPTRPLNMDVMNQLLDEVRTKSGMASKPTSRQFVKTYRKCVLYNCVKPKKRKTSAQDLTKWLIQIQSNNFKELLSNEVNVSGTDDKVQKSQFKISTSDYNEQEFDKNHCLFEVSHFLLSKCKEKHECKIFKSYTKPYKSIPDFIKESRYHGYKEYCEVKRKSLLVVPCDNFVQFVRKMDARFVPCFKMDRAKNNIGTLLYNSIIDEPYNCPPCACFPKTYLVKLFIRLKLYNILKSNNKAFGWSRANAGKFVVNRY